MEIMVFIGLLTLSATAYAGYRYGEQTALRHMHWLDDSEASDEMRDAASGAVRERSTRRLNRIVQKAHANNHLTNDDVEDMFCIGDRTASRYLHQLVEDKKLYRHGEGRGTYYTPVRLEPLEKRPY